jgi:hypothetical protein
MIIIFFNVAGEIGRDRAQKPSLGVSKRKIQLIAKGASYLKGPKIIDESVDHPVNDSED